MSFCSEVKNELCTVQNKKCCSIAELQGMLLFMNTFKKDEIKLITEHEKVANRMSQICVNMFDFTPEVTKNKYKNGYHYTITITNEEYLGRIMLTFSRSVTKLSSRIDHYHLQNECCRAAFLRGAFLSGGIITTPEKGYHLEFVTPKSQLCRDMITLLEEFELSPKETTRSSKYVVYFKDSGAIEDILSIMGAQKSSFEFMNEKIIKELRNESNRINNCEIANIEKTISASGKQIDAIKKLKKNGKFKYLSEELQNIANTRITNPEMSLSEMSNLLKINKSTLNNRLTKLIALAKEK